MHALFLFSRCCALTVFEIEQPPNVVFEESALLEFGALFGARIRQRAGGDAGREVVELTQLFAQLAQFARRVADERNQMRVQVDGKDIC